MKKLLFIFSLSLGFSSNVQALTCVKAVLKNGKITLTSFSTNKAKCPNGSVGALSGPAGAAGEDGINGTNGTNGSDGALKVYGSGSDGDVTFSTSSTFDPSKQYDDITVAAGVTLTLPAGTIVRCTGNFINNGTVNVALVQNGGYVESSFTSNAVSTASQTPAGLGFSALMPDNGTIANNTAVIAGGFGGNTVDFLTPIAVTSAKALLFPLRAISAGGGGAAANSTTGGGGGGAATIACAGNITNSGLISAVGGASNAGGGGGGGGVIVLASKALLTNSGTINVSGGGGGSVDATSGAGGGGSGGIVALIAPTVISAGTVTVSGGSGVAAAGAGTVTSTIRKAGAGGGATGGAGGNGQSVNTNGSTSSSTAGGVGLSFTVATDPTSLLL